MGKYAKLYVDDGKGDPTDPDVGSMSDEDLRDVFESMLRARRLARAGIEMTYTAAMLALTKASCLVRELTPWAGKILGLICTSAEYESMSTQERRALIGQSLYYQLQVLQPQARVELALALGALDVGETPQLLEKAKTGRRRASPALVVRAEYAILKWIRWQYGRGRKLAEVEAEVANALNCTPTLFPKWKTELGKLYGAGFVRDSLVEAERLGRAEVAKEIGTARETEIEEFIRRLGAATLEPNLDVLIALRRKGTRKRRTPV